MVNSFVDIDRRGGKATQDKFIVREKYETLVQYPSFFSIQMERNTLNHRVISQNMRSVISDPYHLKGISSKVENAVTFFFLIRWIIFLFFFIVCLRISCHYGSVSVNCASPDQYTKKCIRICDFRHAYPTGSIVR